MKELEARLNETLQAQPPQKVWRRIKKQRIEVASDLVDIPYHGEPELNPLITQAYSGEPLRKPMLSGAMSEMAPM